MEIVDREMRVKQQPVVGLIIGDEVPYDTMSRNYNFGYWEDDWRPYELW